MSTKKLSEAFERARKRLLDRKEELHLKLNSRYKSIGEKLLDVCELEKINRTLESLDRVEKAHEKDNPA